MFNEKDILICGNAKPQTYFEIYLELAEWEK